MLNNLHQNILWSMKGNFFDIPTDCPQRSERLGWTQDADVFASTASYLMDVKYFYSKWLTDLRAEQSQNGAVPVTIPTRFRAQIEGVAAWSDAAVTTPWTMYEKYGDKALLEQQYPSMKAWIDYVKSVSPDELWKANGYGDWLPAGPKTPLPYLDQCYWYHSTQTLIKAAKVLGKTADIATYTTLLQRIKAAYDKEYKNNLPETQTAYVLGIHFGLLDKSYLPKLVSLIHQNNDHLATGFMGTPYLLSVLSENGEKDLAYKILMQKDSPSWLYMISKGTTTMWEKWDGISPDGSLLEDVSFNHYAFGSVGNWLYENIAGIRPISPGYEKIRIQPLVGGGITWAKGSYESGYGKIVSGWKIDKDKVTLSIEIPKGTTAEVHLPGGKVQNVKAGKYQFTGSVKALK